MTYKVGRLLRVCGGPLARMCIWCACRHSNVLRNGVSVRVLLVEDSPASQVAFRELLEALGFPPPSIVGNESAATEWLQTHHDVVDAVVLDLLLLEGSGFNLIDRAKVCQPHAKVIVFSSYATPAVAEKCRQMGADAVFRKSELVELTSYLKALGSGAAAPPLGALP
jgi:two-component system, OmpR family, response regulator